MAELPTQARIVIIGGGVMGASVSWDYQHTPGIASSETSYIKLPPEYFSLWISNRSSLTTTRVIVDWGRATQASITTAVPPDPNIYYWFGFFGSHSNNNVRVESGSNWWLADPLEEPKPTNGVGSKVYYLILL